jgi:hypothetical protein
MTLKRPFGNEIAQNSNRRIVPWRPNMVEKGRLSGRKSKNLKENGASARKS